MEDIDREILDIIQTEFPIQSRPYAVIGDRTGITEAECLARVRVLQQRGIIRRIGANFQSRMFGWKSTLCAAAVSEDKLPAFVQTVNSFSGVTHNYLREHQYNVWFTLISPSWKNLEASIQQIEEQTGVEILNLPAEKVFKIKVDFRMQENSNQE